MPYKTVQAVAPLLLSHNGVDVYYTFKENDMSNMQNEYHYVLDDSLNVEDSFDVRELTTWKEPLHPPFLVEDNNTPENRAAWDQYRKGEFVINAIKLAIIAAIDSGELKPYEQLD